MMEPSPALAASIAERVLEWRDVAARRFTTGLAFFVYEVSDGRQAAVVRMGLPHQRAELANGVRLSQMLRPLGVPLPRLLTDGTDEPLPFIVMERLGGTDLQDVVAGLGQDQLRSLASAIAAAQIKVGSLGGSGRFGYAPTADAAPWLNWSEVVAAHLARSRMRLETNGIFAVEAADELQAMMQRLLTHLDQVEARPFLHDATTKNVIVTAAGELSGIVDVDDLCWGDVRYAVALTEVALWSRGLSRAYAHMLLEELGLERDAVYALYIAAFVLDFQSEIGGSFNGNPVAADADAVESLRSMLKEAMRDLG